MFFFQKPKAANRSIHSAIGLRAVQIGIAAFLVYFAVALRLSGDIQENSLLAEAVERNDVQAATALLQSGADPNQYFTFDNPAVRSDRWNGVTAQWQWLKNRTGVFDPPQRESLLWMTTQQRHLDDMAMARLLLRHGANPNRAGNDADTALLYAAGEGNAAFVKLLIVSGADVNQTGANGQTALTHAIGSASVYNLEIERRYRNYHNGKSDPNGYNYSETIRLLLAGGANPNTPMVWNPKDTPLQYARRESLFDFITPLTEAGAN